MLLLCSAAQESPAQSGIVMERDSFGYLDAIRAAKINLDSGVTILRHLIERGRSTENNQLIFLGYFGLGAVYSNKGDYTQSRNNYYMALSYGIKGQFPHSNICRVLNNVGNMYLMQGNYKEAAFYCFRAAKLAEPHANNDTRVADQLVRIYNNIATSLLYMKEYDRVLYYLDRAEAIAKRIQHYILLPSIYNNKGLMYKHTGDPKNSWDYYKKALALAQKYRHYQEEHVALRGMADQQISRKHYEQAIPYLEEAAGIRGVLHPSYTARTLNMLGHVYFLQGDYKRAGASLHAALAKANEAQSLDCMLETHRQLAWLYAKTGDHTQAFENMNIAYTLNDSLLNKTKVETVSQIEVKYRTAQKDKEIVQNQLFINNQKRKLYQQNTWIWISSLGLLLLTSTSLFLFVLYRNNRHKQSIQEQQIRGMKQAQQIIHLKSVMEGEEKERTRIARELHDGIGGLLAAVKMNFSSLEEHCTPVLPASEKKEILKKFANITDIIDETGGEIRKTAHNLMPDILEKHGLTEALQLYCEKINGNNSLYLRLDIRGNPDHIPEAVRLPVYRIIQELILNILKHAHATNAMVRLTTINTDLLEILIRDNGRGFDPLASRSGIGLRNIQSRVQMLHGDLSVDSSIETGTTVQISINFRNFKDTLSYEHPDSHR